MMACRLLNSSNISWSSSFGGNTSAPGPEMDSHEGLYMAIEHFLYSKVILVICIIGILGNILNLVVLTRKSLSTRMDRMEKSAHMGLIALAISDLLFCITAFPHSLQDRALFEHDHIGFWLLYEIYGNAIINIFIMASTWLTVAMAVSRYLAICYPMKGREVLGVTFSTCAIVVVFVFCILFNLPRLFFQQVDYIECEGGGFSYYSMIGPMQESDVAETVYLWFYFVFCIMLPLIVLAYCNWYLVRALRMSASMRREHTRGRDAASDSKNLVTLTLTVIVFLYFVLVTPAEILNFTKYHAISSIAFVSSTKYNVAVACGNTLQALNFAGNFLLYCVINVHFRRTVKELFGCQEARRTISRWSTTRYESVTVATMIQTTAYSSPVDTTRL